MRRENVDQGDFVVLSEAKDLHLLARSGVCELPLYTRDVPAGALDLGDNTNLWGAPPTAVRVLCATSSNDIARYPSPYSAILKAAMLRYVRMDGAPGVDVVTGCGSDDVLDSTMRAFGGTGDSIAYSAPTFSMIPIFARLNGLESIAIPLTQSVDVDAERLVDCNAKITYVCTPNNPTGTVASRAAVEYVVTHARGIVLLDEAYAEFAPETFAGLVCEHEKLIVTRTFSKAFGLAGLRVGFGVGSSAIVDLVSRARGPYKVNAMAERAVLAALEPDGVAWVRDVTRQAIASRQRLTTELATLGLVALPSAANFVFVPTARARELANGLRERGVLVGVHDAALRIGVGPWEMMQTLIGALTEVLECA